MRKRTREILALVLLGIFAIVGASAMFYYIVVGHNWNVAASKIDESIGTLDGYTVVMFTGTRTPASLTSSSSSSSGSSSSPSAASDEASSASASSSSSTNSKKALAKAKKREKKLLKEAEAVYREKGARVFTVHADDLGRYSDPFIVAKSGERLGFMSVLNNELRSHVRANIAELSQGSPDYVVAVTNDPTLDTCAEDGLLDGVSIAICDGSKGLLPHEEWHGSTFCVNAPRHGKVGIVIIAPSGVMTAKTLSKL